MGEVCEGWQDRRIACSVRGRRGKKRALSEEEERVGIYLVDEEAEDDECEEGVDPENPAARLSPGVLTERNSVGVAEVGVMRSVREKGWALFSVVAVGIVEAAALRFSRADLSIRLS
jgi:hypothetical protein